MVCAECMKMCCLGGKNSVVKGLSVADHCGSGENPAATDENNNNHWNTVAWNNLSVS